MQSGQLIVTNLGEAKIQLNGVPVQMNVTFTDGGEIFIPCDPHLNDKLDWVINKDILTIKWNVSGIREIKWNIWFYWSEIQ